MKLVVASDEKTPLNEYVINYLRSLGHELTLIGDLDKPNGKWAEISGLARKWNDANILVMGNVNTKNDTAKTIINTWFATSFDEEGLAQAHTLDSL